MPVYSIAITRTAVFGIECENMLIARAKAREALKDMESAGVIDWIETVEDPVEVPEEDIIRG